MPFHAKGRGLLRKMDTTSKTLCALRPVLFVLARQGGLTFPHQKNHSDISPDSQDPLALQLVAKSEDKGGLRLTILPLSLQGVVLPLVWLLL